VVGAGCVGVVAPGGAVGVVTVGVAVVGGRTSGSDFSPQPARATVAAATTAATIECLRRPPTFDPWFTPRNLTQAFRPVERGNC
jgi:hypothetical protein